MARRKTPYPWWLRTRRGYTRYINNSPEWAAFRERYWETHERRCFSCPETRSIRLHHISYRRVGHERPSDVVPLCEKHHKEVHALVAQGVPLYFAHRRLAAD